MGFPLRGPFGSDLPDGNPEWRWGRRPALLPADLGCSRDPLPQDASREHPTCGGEELEVGVSALNW